MPEEQNIDYTQEGAGDEPLDGRESYIERLRKRVVDDYGNAKKFMRDFHSECVDNRERYFNALKWKDLKKDNKFPASFLQQQIDEFVAYMMDKLYYKDRPCRVLGVEDTDKKDAEAKQAMMAWQDQMDDMYRKSEVLLRDASMYRIGVAKVDYTEIVRRQVVGEQVPQMIPNEYGEPVEVMVSRAVPQDKVIYRGPTVKRVSPWNFFITQEKKQMDDEHPVMIREYVSETYFNKPYFFNQDQLKVMVGAKESDKPGGIEVESSVHNARMIHGLTPDQTSKRESLEYVEWQARVNKRRLYEFLEKLTKIEVEGEEVVGAYNDHEGFDVVGEDDTCLAICGMVNEKVVVRLEETPFEFDHPNYVVFDIQPDEDEMIGTSIADKIVAVAEAKDNLNDIYLSNFKQTVNAGHVVNKNALLNDGDVKVNKPGFVIETNDDVSKVHKRIDQQRVAPDIYMFDEKLTHEGQKSSGVQDILAGRGQPGTETLGESEIVAAQASLRMTSYLRSFERGIKSLYEIRNQINMQFLDAPYVYRVIGDKAGDWRTIEPAQIRAGVDFVCESASREVNRIVISQQILQVVKALPLLTQMGIPVRGDKLVARLCEQGFSWSSDMIEEIFPSLRLEKEEGGIDIDAQLLANMITFLQAQGAMAGQGVPGGASSGNNSPEPRSEREAERSLMQTSRTDPVRG